MNRNGTINHIELNVSRLRSSRHFWGWLLSYLGYSLYQEWDAGFSYKLNDTYIVFTQTEEKHLGTYNRKHTGLNHIAFSVDKRDIVDAVTNLLKKKGIPILYLDKHPFAGGKDSYAVYFEDPDRIKVEVVVCN